MFSGFTKETSDFLWELSFNNERPWFQEHKAQFERCLKLPFGELAADTLAETERRFPDTVWKLHVSRIYRDARRLFGRGPYKERLWFSIRAQEALPHGPGFWFEIGAAQYSYGMGFYDARPYHMEAFRRSIDANPAAFRRLARGVERLGQFNITGAQYKRPKGDIDPLINLWYNRRWLGLECSCDFGGELLEGNLPVILAEAYERLMPMYKFFLSFYRMAEDQEAIR